MLRPAMAAYTSVELLHVWKISGGIKVKMYGFCMDEKWNTLVLNYNNEREWRCSNNDSNDCVKHIERT